MGYSKSPATTGPVTLLPGKVLSNREAAAEVSGVVGRAALAAGAAAAPVVGAGLVANQLYERYGEDQGQGEKP